MRHLTHCQEKAGGSPEKGETKAPVSPRDLFRAGFIMSGDTKDGAFEHGGRYKNQRESWFAFVQRHAKSECLLDKVKPRTAAERGEILMTVIPEALPFTAVPTISPVRVPFGISERD